MELDSFDLLINLVALGLGVGFVPQRALPLYARRRKVRRVPVEPRFRREVVVVTSRELPRREHVQQFVDGILFSDTFAHRAAGGSGATRLRVSPPDPSSATEAGEECRGVRR